MDNWLIPDGLKVLTSKVGGFYYGVVEDARILCIPGMVMGNIPGMRYGAGSG